MQLSWIDIDALPPYRIQIRTITTDYDTMTGWCQDNCRGDYLQSWGGEHDVAGAPHRFYFTDADDLMRFKLTFGGTVFQGFAPAVY